MLTYIKADYFFDSIKGEFRKDPIVIVELDRISGVKYGEVEIPENSKVINHEGCTLLPGFIDGHDHLALSPQLKNHPQLMSDPDPLLMLRGIQNMKIDLAKGITTSRCLGDKNFIDLYLKNAVEEGVIEGPRIFTCTRGIKPTHAHGSVGTVFNGVEEVRRAVRENLQRGADFIKIFTTDTVRESEYMPYYMSPEEMSVAVKEAHQVGKKVAAHSIGGDGLTHCIEQGVDIIEHAYFATEEQIESMIKHNRWVCLTPSIFFNDERWNTVPAEIAQKFKNNREEVLEVHKRLIQSGIHYAIGTDATHGELDNDVIFLTSIGEKPERALQGITINAAKLCEMDNEIGSITIGKKADLVAVKGNAEKDIRAIKSVAWVMKDGLIKKDEHFSKLSKFQH